jgi:putative transposase
LRIGQAWLVKGEDGLYLKVVFSKTVEVVGSNGMAAAVDINENNIAFGSMECVSNIETGERAIRTAYSLKRRKLQSRHRLNEESLLVKYSGMEEDRDIIAVKNLLRRYQRDVGSSTVHPENPPMKGGGKA